MIQSEYKALQEKLDATNVELSELKKTHEESQKSHESARNAWSDDKKTLEGTILELSTSAGDRTTHEEDLRRQEERIKVCPQLHSLIYIGLTPWKRLLENDTPKRWSHMPSQSKLLRL